MRKIAMALWLGLLPGLAYAAPPAGVSVQKAWVRYLLPTLPAAAYMTLSNDSDMPDVLVGASSPACGTLMLHESMDMGGTAMMMAVPNVLLPAHGSLILGEGGYHLMCMDPKLQGVSKISITLQFQDGTSLGVSAPVYGATDAP